MPKIETPKTTEELDRALEENLNRVIVAVLPNAGTPVTHWMVVGPFFNAGEDDDMHDAMDFLLEDYDEAIAQAVGVVESHKAYSKNDEEISIIVYPQAA